MLVRLRMIGLVLLIGTLAPLSYSRATTAQFGPLLAVYVDPTTAEPGDWVGVTVIASGSGSYARLTVNVPAQLTIGDDLKCVHKTLYCDAVSATGGVVTASARNDVTTGASAIVTVTFSVLVPHSAVPGTRYEINATMDGLFNVLQPEQGTGASTFAVLTIGGAASQQPRPTPTPAAGQASQTAADAPSIRITKKVCDNSAFPVFVESHCSDDTGASFEIEAPNLMQVATLRSGDRFQPTVEQFARGDMWRILDTQPSTYVPVTVLSCLHHRPGDDVMLGVAPVGNPRGLQRWDVWWTSADTGDGEQYTPSLECIWFELPNVAEIPAVLSLQAFTSTEPYLAWTDAKQTGLGEFARGESGENLEANMVMSNRSTGEVYSFAADAYGQVLIRAGDYDLQSADTGHEARVRMPSAVTVLAEIGLGDSAAASGLPSAVVRTTIPLAQIPNGECDPSYPGVCIPPTWVSDDLDCGDISYRRFSVLPPNPHNFDGGFDGVGCENG